MIVVRRYDVCKANCVSYAKYPDATECPRCGVSRYNDQGSPWKTFFYIPILHRIALWHTSEKYVAEMRAYKDKFAHTMDAGSFENREFTEDYWDSWLCHTLRQGRGLWNDLRDIGLALMTDGLSLFQIGPHETWPIVIVNTNLPPHERIKKHRVLICGSIPGPTSPKEIDSFLWPLIQELKQLEKGIKVLDLEHMAAVAPTLAPDEERDRWFTLRGGLTYIIADGMAQSKLMRWTGPGSYNICRFCGIYGIWWVHIYCPHKKPTNIELEIRHEELPPKDWDTANLPIRTDHEVREAMRTSQEPLTAAGREKAARVSGFHGESGFCDLQSVVFPWSFTPGIMHMTHKNATEFYLRQWIPPSEKKKKLTVGQRRKEIERKRKDMDRRAKDKKRVSDAKARARLARSQGSPSQLHTQTNMSEVPSQTQGRDDDAGAGSNPDENERVLAEDAVPVEEMVPEEEEGPPPPYRIDIKDWKVIGVDMESSRASIPGAFGKALRNIQLYNKSFKTSELKNWLLFIAPILLNGRLDKQAYEHFRCVPQEDPRSVKGQEIVTYLRCSRVSRVDLLSPQSIRSSRRRLT